MQVMSEPIPLRPWESAGVRRGLSGMRNGVVTWIALALSLSACANASNLGPGATPTVEERYEADATVLQAEGPARLCLGSIATSLPPQCGDVPIAGWNWDEVDGEQRLNGVIWGDYHVVGTYDGAAFTVLDVSAHETPAPDSGDPFASPCPAPAGGWVAVDPEQSTEQDRTEAMHLARGEPDFAGIWIDYLADTLNEEDPGPYVLNVAFTGDIDRHEAELRAVWGGPLCVVQFERTYRELLSIQQELSDGAAAALELQLLWSDTSELTNRVEIGVVLSGAEEEAALEATYGKGTVYVISALRPAAVSS
jgi:hypothetical protein